jgi:hypothetical protein
MFGTLWVELMSNPIRINQLPVPATGWQHESQIYFETFIYPKITKIANSSTTPKAK